MWSPITITPELPTPGTREQLWLDFKARVHGDNRYELAKDVASLANASGGTILVGATEQASTLSAYCPLEEHEARQTAKAYEEAVRDLVRPTPLIQVCVLPVDEGFVLTVNVWPFPGQLVGVELKGPDQKRKNLFHYPVRVGSQTNFVTPEQIPMFTDARVRRISIALEAGRQNRIFLYEKGANALSPRLCKITSLDLTANTLVLHTIGENASKLVNIPLDVILTVSKRGELSSSVYIDGWFEDIGAELVFHFFAPLRGA